MDWIELNDGTPALEDGMYWLKDGEDLGVGKIVDYKLEFCVWCCDFSKSVDNLEDYDRVSAEPIGE